MDEGLVMRSSCFGSRPAHGPARSAASSRPGGRQQLAGLRRAYFRGTGPRHCGTAARGLFVVLGDSSKRGLTLNPPPALASRL